MSAEKNFLFLLLRLWMLALTFQVTWGGKTKDAIKMFSNDRILDSWGCNFQDGLCGMTVHTGNTTTWERNNTLPQNPDASDQWYITLTGKGIARLETPKLAASETTTRCLTFYYYINGANPGALSIIPRYGNSEPVKAEWTQGLPQGDEWMAAYVDIYFGEDVSVIIEGERIVDTDGMIAIDEINFRYVSCDVHHPTETPDLEMVCDFEESLCDFEIEDEKGTWLWIYPKQGNISFPHAPLDHTYHTGYGHYLAAPLMNNQDGVVGRVVTPEFQLERQEPQCLSFWYIHNGQTIRDTLSVFVRHGIDIFPKAAWVERANHGFGWMWANIPIPTGRTHFNVVWEARQQRKDQQGVMLLDDVELHNDACPKIGTCDFQYGTCGWQNLYASENDTGSVVWLQAKGSDGLGSNTPGSDHNGDAEAKFLYMDGSTGVDGTAVLESQLLVPEQHNDFCFSFWYYLEGDAEGIQINSIIASGTETVLWEESKPTDGNWIQGQVRVEAKIFILGDIAYQLYIRGTRTSENAKVGLDDFQFVHNTDCPRLPVFATNIPPTPEPIQEIWGCNFQDDVCNMIPIEGFTAMWIRDSNLTQLPGVQDLWYITMSGEGYAAIETPMLESLNSPCCLTFYYYFNGANGGALSVIPRYQVGNIGEALWSQGRPQGDMWVPAHADIDMLSPVSVVFEGLKGVNQDATIAVDELRVYGASCNIVQPTEVPGQKLMCDFEDSLCGFTIENEIGTWEWIYPKQNISFPHSDRDHTYNTGYGHYLAAPLWNGRDGIVGRVVTPEYQLERQTPQCLTFWYIHNGWSTLDVLAVYVRQGIELFPRPAWKDNANHGYSWLWANIPIPTGNTSFNVVWQVTQRQRDQDGVISLDDVELVLNHCPKIGTCNFQYGTCGWQNLYNTENVTDDIDWLQGKGSDGLNNDAPATDHNGDADGKFLYIDARANVFGTATLESQLLVPEQHNDFCFSFWYFLEGEVGGISIATIVASGEETILWEETAVTQGTWVQGQVRVQAKMFIFEDVAYQILIRGTKHSNNSKVALDDFDFKIEQNCARLPIESTPQPPTSPPVMILWHCTFDTDACNMGITGDAMWAITENGAGERCLGLSGSPGLEARASLPILAAQSGMGCLTFSYFLKGGNLGALSVLAIQGGVGEALWTRGRPLDSEWHIAGVNIPLDGFTQIVMVGLRGENTESVIALDDMHVSSVDCGVVHPTSDPGDSLCDFEESDICGYTTYEGLGNWQWFFPNYDNLSVPHVPVDHTYNTGYGHYMEAQLLPLDQEGVVGYLVSPDIPVLEDVSQCAVFWYVHNGNSNQDVLSVFITSTDDIGYPLWREKASYIDHWLDASVPIPRGLSQVFRIYWEAKQRQRNDYGSMSIDDVSIIVEPCASIGSCNFTTSMCGWQNVIIGDNRTDATDFIRGTGIDGIDYGAPPTDHNGDPNGVFLYVDTTFGATGVALLESQMLVPEQHNNLCFHFWYYIKGNESDYITIELQPQDFSIHEVWTQRAKDDQWHEGQVHVNAEELGIVPIPYQLFIAGKKGSSYAVIALDDFSFTTADGINCPKIPGPAPVTTPVPAGQNVSCDFTNGQCGWINRESNTINWKYDALNYNMYIESNDTNAGTDEYYTGAFYSPTFHVDSTACITLDWKKIDEMDGVLYVFLYTDTGEEMGLLMSENAGTTEEYCSAEMEISFRGAYRLSIVGIVPKQWEGVMAFTKVLFEDGPCSESLYPGQIFCDFETPSKCGFHTSLPGDSAVWTLGSGHPVHDHSLNSFLGHDVYIDVIKVRGKIAHLATPNITMESDHFCAIFWYFDELSTDVTLSVYSQQGNEKSDVLWVMKREYAYEWKGVSVYGPAAINQSLMVVWEAVATDGAVGMVAIDDVTVKQGICPEPGSCSFDQDLCLWTQLSTDQLNWITVNSIGDLHEHTNNNGSLLGFIIDGSSQAGDTAILESEILTITETACLTFWYNMFGAAVGSLTVVEHLSPVEKFDSWRLESGVSLASGNWSFASLPIKPSSASNILITLHARVADNSPELGGQIAVDDINLELAVQCAYEPSTAQVPTSAPPTSPPFPTPSPGFVYNCNYESNHNVLCDWVNIEQDRNHRWEVVKGSLSTEGVGPVGDHTTGTGHYVTHYRSVAVNSEPKTDYRAILQSPHKTITQPSCFLFFYFTWGQNANLTIEFNGEKRWAESGSTGNIWRSSKLSIDNNTTPDLYINIVSLLGEDMEDIFTSVDDIYLYETTCDLIDVDGSLQYQCNLEYSSICDWQQPTDVDETDWQWTNGTNGAFPEDHSYQTDAGHYVQLSSAQAGVTTGQRAVLQLTENKNMPAHDYCFQIYVRFGGYRNGDINIMMAMDGEVHRFLNVPGRDGPTGWIFIQQTYQNVVQNSFAFVIEGTVGNATGQTEPSVIAIDDYSLTFSACPRAGSCEFEEAHLCTWSVEDTYELTWKLSDGQEIHGNGPDVDHTTNTSIGGFAIMEIFDGLTGNITSLVSEPIMDDIYGFCFSFFYFMSCDAEASLQIIMRSNGTETLLWSLDGEFSSQWMFGKVGIPTSSFEGTFATVVRGIAGSAAGWIAVDDLITSTGECGIEPPGATPFPIVPTTPMPGGIFNCNFEIDICGLIQSAADNFDWMYQYDPEPEELPPGGYIIADSVYLVQGFNASIDTPELSYSGLQCLTFDYQILGSQPGILRIYVSVGGNDGDAVWHKSVTTIKEWLPAHVEINAQVPYSLKWIAIVEGQDSIILVDNILVTAGQCSIMTNTCDFEYEGQTSDQVCGGYLNDATVAEYKFYRTTSAVSLDTYAHEDHTYESTSGHYVVADFSKSVSAGELAVMFGPLVGDVHNCLTFWYQFDTPDTNVFRALVNGTEEIIFLQEFGSGPLWRLGSGKIGTLERGRIVFEAYSSGTHSGYIAIDDIKLFETIACPIHGNCDFEKDTCGWTNDKELKWVFGKNYQPEGPLTPTLLMFVSPAEVAVGAKSVLTSPILLPYVTCVKFWYQRKALAPGFLEGKVASGPGYLGTPFEMRLWQSPDEFYDAWVHAQFPIPTLLVDSLQVIFEATRLDGSWAIGHNDGMILLDDVEVSEAAIEECDLLPPSAQPPPTLPPTTTKTPPIPPSQANCDFSNQDYCAWRLDATGITWSIAQGIGGTHSVGPLADHTTGDGFYMSLTPAQQNLEGVAKLISPDMLATQDLCMRWWYHLDGSDVRQLSINLHDPEKATQLWLRYGFQSSGWVQAYIGISSALDFVLEIEGTQGSNPLANIAVDDITFVESICPENTGAFGIETMFCTFEQGQECGLVDSSHDGWVPTKGDLSIIDHTTSTAEGHMFILRGRDQDITRSLVTPQLSKVPGGQCLTFYYLSGGQSKATLSFWAKNYENLQLSEKRILLKQEKPEWRGVQMSFYEFFGSGFVVVFEGDMGNDPNAFIAIDDFSLTPGICNYDPTDCKFADNSLCLWTSERNSDIQWYVSDGASGHQLNGPPSEGFNYLIFQTGPHHQSGSVARIMSPMIIKDEFAPYYCLKFLFKSSIEHSGVLSVRFVQNAWNISDTVLWELPITTEFVTSEWTQALVPIEDLKVENFLLAIQADSWDGREGYITIRDITLIKEVCHVTPWAATPVTTTTTTGVPVTATPMTTPSPQGMILECDFENATAPICDFKQDVGDIDGIWNRYDASSPPSPMHPGADHTTHSETGHYLAASYQSMKRNPGLKAEATARIRTPPLEPNKDYCFSFFYHHVGNSPPRMVSFAEAFDGPEQVTLWREDYPQQDGWMYVQRDVFANTINQPFIITIDATLFDGMDGDASLDDLKGRGPARCSGRP